MSDQVRIRADFSQPHIVPYDDVEWTPSPAAGVDRKMLDRIGNEVARATSIVRYAPESSFEPHVHGGGEEILVLSGVFSDESGDYPAGTYLRNPPGSEHTPGSAPGCIIFVKLRQFAPDDQTQVARSLDSVEWVTTQPGIRIAPLHEYDGVSVRMLELSEGTTFSEQPPGGLECLIFQGAASLGSRPLGRWGWARVPAGDDVSVVAEEDSMIWMKTGHLSVNN